MTEKDIRDAYCRIRTIDNTIPDEVLSFMLYASLKELGVDTDKIGGILQNINFSIVYGEDKT